MLMRGLWDGHAAAHLKAADADDAGVLLRVMMTSLLLRAALIFCRARWFLCSGSCYTATIGMRQSVQRSLHGVCDASRGRRHKRFMHVAAAAAAGCAARRRPLSLGRGLPGGPGRRTSPGLCSGMACVCLRMRAHPAIAAARRPHGAAAGVLLQVALVGLAAWEARCRRWWQRMCMHAMHAVWLLRRMLLVLLLFPGWHHRLARGASSGAAVNPYHAAICADASAAPRGASHAGRQLLLAPAGARGVPMHCMLLLLLPLLLLPLLLLPGEPLGGQAAGRRLRRAAKAATRAQLLLLLPGGLLLPGSVALAAMLPFHDWQGVPSPTHILLQLASLQYQEAQSAVSEAVIGEKCSTAL